MKKNLALAVVGATAALALAGCSAPSSDSNAENVTIQYWLWDDTQLPLYQACADTFHKENPNITVKLTQTAWGQYWQNLSTQIAAGTGPDVFTNQISYFGQYAESNQLLDLNPALKEAGVDVEDFSPGLAERWVVDDKRFGVPKDWDAVAVLYDADAATSAGYTAEEVAALDWNPTDGGTFETFIRAMTLDSAGRSALDPAFDKGNVERYGYYTEWADGAVGQSGWGNFAHSAGFTYTDDSGSYNFDSEPLVETATWLHRLIEDGIAPPFDKQSTLGTQAVMEDGTAAVTIQGSWLANSYLSAESPKAFAFAPVPTGPEGRAAARNGLADSVWSGSKHPQQASEWVAYLGSAECQNSVAESGRIFPSRTEATKIAMEARNAAGIDSTAFTSVADAGETFMVPSYPRGAEVNAVVQDALQAVAQGAPAQETLERANTEVESLAR